MSCTSKSIGTPLHHNRYYSPDCTLSSRYFSPDSSVSPYPTHPSLYVPEAPFEIDANLA
jgi:hypothetical protein